MDSKFIEAAFYGRKPLKGNEVEVTVDDTATCLLLSGTELAKWRKGNSFIDIHAWEEIPGRKNAAECLTALLNRTLHQLVIKDNEWFLFHKVDKTTRKLSLLQWIKIPITYDIYVK
jgi:hypothetical protein